MHWYHWIFSLLLMTACYSNEEQKSPAGYDLSKPEKFTVPDALLEISGIAYHNDLLYAVQDEEGKLFNLRPGDKKAASSKFGKKGDYEDISIARGQVFILRSDGTLYSFPLDDARQNEITSTREWKDLVPKGEYEGLYADESTGLIYVLCKECKQDKKSSSVSIFVLKLQSDGNISPSHTAALNVQKNFKPSALAIHPLTKEWYILSSVNKLLVIADSQWKVKETYKLNPAIFRQPEGITFDPQNNLYISNEGDELSNGNVLKFIYNKTN